MAVAAVEPVTAEIKLANEAGAARLVRQFVAQKLGSVPFGAPDIVDVVQLLASELVTNVVRHTDTNVMTVSLSLDANTLRLAVQDDSRERPMCRAAKAHDEGGRGLPLIKRLSCDWGVEDIADGGKTVWTLLEVG
ncbi:ATP-binding protein [Streptacidiphilus sp. N1-3]|uniref:ATP-binding protein n=1 Tax=Streptacidiphilus alkalitolerans TaxID=3342712 RepID=A0ABV6XDR7_9ACTN